MPMMYLATGIRFHFLLNLISFNFIFIVSLDNGKSAVILYRRIVFPGNKGNNTN